ncbi:MAG TPA: glycosyltransferase family 4 protein, partial [Candidatus Dormibacteraeota bacterium]|nr:glycosyltransferase family 4 protein [Candidatus Dormibacteraeota bacterium]
MKVAILSDAISPFHQGGKETLHFERTTRLAGRGHEVRIFTMHWWQGREREVIRDGVHLYAIGPRIPLYTRKGRRSIWQSVVFGLSTIRLIWAPAFDVLDVDQFPFSQFFVARLVCSIRRKPMTATWHEVWDPTYWKHYMGWLGRIGVWLQRSALRRADLVFANSALTASRLTSWMGVDQSRVLVLPPAGIESLRLPTPTAGVSRTIDCIFIGRLLSHKHVDVLVRALATLPGVSGLIIGNGPERDRLQALAGEFGIADRLRFETTSSHDAVIDRLRAARLFVSASTREGFGISVFEANACGVPALVVRHPDNSALEMVRDGKNGLVCDLDAEAIAERIGAYLADPAMQVRMSRAAEKAAAAYSWESHVSRMVAALESLQASRVRSLPG